MPDKRRKKILILAYLDGVANSVRSVEVKRILAGAGYQVKILDTADRSFLDMVGRCRGLLRGGAMRGRPARYFRSRPFIESKEAAAETARLLIGRDRYDVIICQSPICSYVLNMDLGCLKIYDCPTPEYYEIKEGREAFRRRLPIPAESRRFYGSLSTSELNELKRREVELYRNCDYVSFHWHSYTDFVKDNLYCGDNLFTLDWGCRTGKRRAVWKRDPYILFLGFLGDYWINIPLIRKLTKITGRRIDCYGTPEPPKGFGLNYKGYMSGGRGIRAYQFGLLTITKDILRRHGFSAKVLDYASHGLPSFIPSWRVSQPDVGGAIRYSEDDFMFQVEYYSDKKRWRRKSDEAYDYAQSHGWDLTLRPLLQILEKDIG